MLSEEELIESLQSFADELGRRPTLHEMAQDGPHSSSVYKKYFGTWSTALHEAGFEPSRGKIIKEEDRRDYYSRDYSKNQKIYERDNHKCRVCDTEDSIEVHHIKSRLNIPHDEELDNEDNMITLCKKHHRILEGKWEDTSHERFEELAREYIENEDDATQKTIASF
jgi:HNH endonuclease.